MRLMQDHSQFCKLGLGKTCLGVERGVQSEIRGTEELGIWVGVGRESLTLEFVGMEEADAECEKVLLVYVCLVL